MQRLSVRGGPGGLTKEALRAIEEAFVERRVLFAAERGKFGQFLALFGLGSETARFDLRWKEEPLPATYVLTILGVTFLFEIIPFVEEFVRGLRANRGALVPPKVPTNKN